MTFSLSEDQGNLSGTGNLSGSGVPTCSPTVSGTHQGQAVNLVITCQGIQPLDYAGNVNGSYSSMRGLMSGSGFVGFTMEFLK